VTSIVTALDDVCVGEVWTLSKLLHLKKLIGAEKGLTWTIVEVLPVHEAIKTGGPKLEWKR
jgi:mannonate dehydratase